MERKLADNLEHALSMVELKNESDSVVKTEMFGGFDDEFTNVDYLTAYGNRCKFKVRMGV